MRFFDFVEEDDAVRATAHGFGQVAALIVADVTGRCADEAGNAVFFHVFAHVEADDGFVAVEEEGSEGAAQFGFADAGRAEEKEGTDGAVRIGQSGAVTADSVCYRFDGGLLADDAGTQCAFQRQQFFFFAFEHFGDGDARPARDDLRDFFFGDFAAHELVRGAAAIGSVRGGQLFFQRRDFAVLDFAHGGEIAAPFRGFEFDAQAVDFFFDARAALVARFFCLPDFVQVGVFFFEFLDVVFEVGEAFFRGVVVFFFKRQAFHFQLDEAAVDAVHRLRLAVEFHADLRGGLVDEVDGFVRQLAVGDVAIGEDGGGDECRVGDVDAVVDFVAFLQAAQDGDGVFHARLFDHDFLEAAFEGGVFFHVLAVFVQRGRADAVQFAACQRRFEHVAGIHGAFGFARADHGMDFVDEEDDLPVGFFDVVEDSFQAFFEIAPVFAAGHQGGKIQREQAFAFQAFRHFAVDDALREAFDDGGFAHARFADEDGVVFVAALQDLHGAADFFVAADDGVDFALLGAGSHVYGVFFQRLAFVFGGFVSDGFAAAQFVDDVLQFGFLQACLFQRLAERAAVFTGGEEEKFG